MASDTSSGKTTLNAHRSGTTDYPARPCKGCGNEFRPNRSDQRYCDRKCQVHRARSERDARFIGVDGEGVDRTDGKHEYVMLSVGDRTLFENGDALPLARILTFLYECYRTDRNAVYVGFFLGYDFTQWFKQLDQQSAWYLFSNAGMEARKTRNPTSNQRVPQPVVWNGWEIDVLAGRRVKLRPHRHRYSVFTGSCRNRTCGRVGDPTNPFDEEPPFDPTGNVRVVGEAGSGGSGKRFWGSFRRGDVGWMYICDTGPFWQCSFLNAINPAGWSEPVCTPEEYAIIVEGKADRGITVEHGDTSYVDDMRRYNVLENDVLARVTARLDAGFRNEHIPICLAKTDWYYACGFLSLPA